MLGNPPELGKEAFACKMRVAHVPRICTYILSIHTAVLAFPTTHYVDFVLVITLELSAAASSCNY